MTKAETEAEIRQSLAEFEAWDTLTSEEKGERTAQLFAFADAFLAVFAPLAESLDWEQDEEIVELPWGEVRQDDALVGLDSGMGILERDE